MKKAQPGATFVRSTREGPGGDGKYFFKTTFSPDPVTPCLVCDRVHDSRGNGPCVFEYDDGRVEFRCWSDKLKTKVKLADRFEYVSENVEFTQVYCEDKVRDFDVSAMSQAISSKEKHTYIIQSGMGTGKSEAIRALEKAIVKIHGDARIVNIFANVSL
eukprot:jgi/Mesvir1/22851/Mv20105-RA.1